MRRRHPAFHATTRHFDVQASTRKYSSLQSILIPLTSTTMSLPSPVAPTARPIPQNIDSTSTIPVSSSPRSPLSPFSPGSDDANTNYFGDVNPASSTTNHGPNGTGNFLQRFTSPTSYRDSSSNGGVYTPSTSRWRTRSKSPSPVDASNMPVSSGRPKSYSAIGANGTVSTTDPCSSPRMVSGSSTQTTKKENRSSGTYTKCGRNGNDWLFGGVRVRDTVKGLFEERVERGGK